jgi:hypothetical protein
MRSAVATSGKVRYTPTTGRSMADDTGAPGRGQRAAGGGPRAPGAGRRAAGRGRQAPPPTRAKLEP